MTMRYRVTYSIDGDTIMVTSIDLPEVTTFADDEAEAAIRGTDAVVTAIMGRIADRQDVPVPSRGPGPYAVLSTSDSIKVGLYQAMRAGGIGKAELARRLHCHLPQIDRLLDLSHASKLEALEAALHAVGKEIDVCLVPAA